MSNLNRYTARTTRQLGAILRRERKAQGLSQGALGERIGLRQATISKLEAGEPGPRLSTLLDALSALGLQLVLEPRSGSSASDLDEIF